MSTIKKPMKRKALTKLISDSHDKLEQDVFFLTAIRPTKNDGLSIEVCQNRILEGQSINALSALNQDDERFGTAGTLLFDWIKVTPKGFVKAFPKLNISETDLEAIIKAYEEDKHGYGKGPEAEVFPVMSTIDAMIVNGKALMPKICVTEVLESTIANGEFFTKRSARQQENIKGALEEEYRVMKTGSDKDAEYIVDAVTGDKIFRYSRTEFVGFPAAVDNLIANKVPQSIYEASKNKTSRASSPGKSSVEDLLSQEEAVR